MITVEIKDASNPKLSEIEIYCDLKGIEDLKRQLDFLISGESHVHLATPSWAGNELCEEKNNIENTLVNQLTIINVSKE